MLWSLNDNKDIMYLGMVIERRETTFIFRTCFIRWKKRKTFHQGANDMEYRNSLVFRLAPRTELERQRKPTEARREQILRFVQTKYGTITALVLQILSHTIKGLIECGVSRGKVQVFDIIEMVNCKEIFGGKNTKREPIFATEKFFCREKNGSTPNYFVQKLGVTPNHQIFLRRPSGAWEIEIEC